jgi:hypothetical protein
MLHLCSILSVLKGSFNCKQADVACPFRLVYDAARTPVEMIPAEILDFCSEAGDEASQLGHPVC